MWFLYLVIFIVYLVIALMLAEEFYAAACDKGYKDRKYFRWAFWTGLPGYLLIIALPNKQQGAAPSSASSTTSAAAKAEPISYPSSYSQAKKSAPTSADMWKCTCGRENASYVSTCACGRSKWNQ